MCGVQKQLAPNYTLRKVGFFFALSQSLTSFPHISQRFPPNICTPPSSSDCWLLLDDTDDTTLEADPWRECPGTGEEALLKADFSSDKSFLQ